MPPGLAAPTAALVEMIDFLRIDVDLVAAAAAASGAVTKGRRPTRRRTVRELRALAETRRAERARAEAARARKAAARAARGRHLAKLARNVDGVWARIERLVKASDYDVAVRLVLDLHEIATRNGAAAAFARRFQALRKRHPRRRGFFDRWKRAIQNEPAERGRR